MSDRDRCDIRGHDAVVLLSFGGPEGPDDVMPFLRNVTAGRGIPDERLSEVAEHYLSFGGRSPINDQNRALRAALETALRARGTGVPVLWGNRNWSPYLADTVREAHRRGHRRLVIVTTSAYSSYSGCRQYREDVAAALEEVGSLGEDLRIDLAGQYWNSEGFVRANADAVQAADERVGAGARLVFVTHSVPAEMARTAGPPPHDGEGAYVRQHREVAELVAARVGHAEWDLVFCSRSGSPHQPWLEPDVNDHLEALADAGEQAVVVSPIGFISDHMEVVYDLDTEAAATASRLGLRYERAATVGTHPAFVSALADLVLGVGGGPDPAGAAAHLVPGATGCVSGCCPNLRAERAAAPVRAGTAPAPGSGSR